MNPQDFETEEGHGRGGTSEDETGFSLNLEIKKKDKY
jgi:hypothetical protein